MATQTLIFGSGECARFTAEECISLGIDPVIAAKNDAMELKDLLQDKIGILPNVDILSCRGVVGNFSVVLKSGGEKTTREFHSIVVAEDNIRQANFPLCGLTPNDAVVSLTHAKTMAAEKSLGTVKRIAFILGLFQDSNPVITQEVMHLCLDLQNDSDIQTYIFTSNLKVGGDGLEKLYRKTRDAGVIYIKCKDEKPTINQKGSGAASLEFTDELTRERFTLTPDMVVVDESIVPSNFLEELSSKFCLCKDETGFIQRDNVHRLSVGTNRKGIFSIGPSRAVQGRSDHQADARNAVVSIMALSEEVPFDPADKAEVLPTCIKCLTCYRICPYRAILLNDKPHVQPQACESCGLCAAECPRMAIRIENLHPSRTAEYLSAMPQNKEFPFIVAFCCRRSAAQAAATAACMGYRTPRGLGIVEMPCAGAVSVYHIFEAFKSGADGVMILTCHQDNCHSEKGNVYANQRTKNLAGLMESVGLENHRLYIDSLASNMASEFSEMTCSFEEKILKLKPSKLKK